MPYFVADHRRSGGVAQTCTAENVSMLAGIGRLLCRLLHCTVSLRRGEQPVSLAQRTSSLQGKRSSAARERWILSILMVKSPFHSAPFVGACVPACLPLVVLW